MSNHSKPYNICANILHVLVGVFAAACFTVLPEWKFTPIGWYLCGSFALIGFWLYEIVQFFGRNKNKDAPEQEIIQSLFGTGGGIILFCSLF